MKKYWFKPKRYGWGVYPISWQGWLAAICFALLCAEAFFILVPESSLALKDYLVYGLVLIFLVGIFFIGFKHKINGPLKWRWGKEE